MEAIGCVASVSQLVNYSYGATQRLINLHRVMQEGPALCRDQSQNILYLLRLKKRICSIKTLDTDTILPLCIAITDQALILLNLLGPREPLRSKWLWMAKTREIEKAFRSLGDKAKILQFYLVERTHSFIQNISGRVASSELTVIMEHPQEDIHVSAPYPD